MAYQFIYMRKDFPSYYEHVLQPASQYLSPEWAHNLGVAAIKYGIFPPEKYNDPSVLVRFFKVSSLIINFIDLINNIHY